MIVPTEFTADDLIALTSCLRDFDVLRERLHATPSDIAVRYSVVKTFELTYEMAIKTLQKYLLYSAASSAVIEGYDFQDLIRRGDQEGLLQNGWPEWKRYRENRNRTAHTYREEIAVAITMGLSDFADEVHVLLKNLRARVESHG